MIALKNLLDLDKDPNHKSISKTGPFSPHLFRPSLKLSPICRWLEVKRHIGIFITSLQADNLRIEAHFIANASL